ncbi:MAG: cation-translocating P-type ATPase [Gammaproteobacteria bacterium]|nr:cation-translocating P-type ATPase [Gammaproteobacteria bacterium]
MTRNLPPYRLPVEALAAELATDLRQGLRDDEARTRLERFGPNELETAAPVPRWKRFLLQFRDPLVVLLLIATAVSAGIWLIEGATGLPYEALAILAVVTLNAVLGHVQQERAEQAVTALRRMSAAQATVVRDGRAQRIATARLVPGDIILVEEGDTVPADARVVESASLQTSEASLTGESQPESKDPEPVMEEVAIGDRQNMIFSGTSVTYGHGRALVTATGMNTQMGLIAGMLDNSPLEETPLQVELARTGRLLGALVIGIALVIIAVILIFREIRGLSAIFDVMILGVALAVAAVPEGLPAVVTAVLALGVQRMARRKAIVRHLAAVETLGSANVIASDKTGTLTRNEMSVRSVVTASGRVDLTGKGYEPEGEVRARRIDGEAIAIDAALRTELERALTAGDRANNARLLQHEGRWIVHGDPTEGALLVAARKIGLGTEDLDRRFARVGEIPFSSERKLMSTIHTDTDRSRHRIVFTKGAPDVLLARCTSELVGDGVRPLSAERRAEIIACSETLASEALRTLGVAARLIPIADEADASPENAHGTRGSVESDLAFAGLIGMIDPPREEAKEAAARAREAGVRAIIITGDHPITASVIGAELGISGDRRAVTGVEIERMSEEEFRKVAREVSVFARVDPEHKLRIVRALQQDGAIVAMTGDGVNDAPALRSADIGVAMGITGTDVSRQAADIVLADDNFATIVAAVEEGRAIFANIRKFLRYLLSSNMGEVLTMFFGVLLADVIGLAAAGEDGALLLPLLATQLLWINMVTDGAPALALGADPADRDVMTRPPRPRGEAVITHRMWGSILFVGIIMATGTLLIVDLALPGGFIPGDGDLRHAQTMAFTTLVFFSLFTVLTARSDECSAFVGLFSNRWLWAAIALSVALQVAVVHVPFLQAAFSTSGLEPEDWLMCAAVASTVLWLSELRKLFSRYRSTRAETRSIPQARA